jgi:hypothetical protein
VATWRQFDTLLATSEMFGSVDIVFYGYDSIHTDANANGSLLYRFVERLFEPGLPVLNDALDRNEGRGIRKVTTRVVLVSHSLGGAISRQAPIYAFDSCKRWTDKLDLVLFAPAHNGAHLIRLALTMGPGMIALSLLGSLATILVPAVRNLEEGSQFITKLRQDTERLLQQHNVSPLKATLVIRCRNDMVVSTERFCQDPAARVFCQTHSSICKPTSAFLEPLHELEGVL